MSKVKRSMKYIKALYPVVFRCRYGDLQFICQGVDPVYYNCGVYGWNCDIYVNFEYDAAITTGYRNLRGVSIPHEIIRKYSEIAKNIYHTYPRRESSREALSNNYEEFWRELMAWYRESHKIVDTDF